MEKKGEGGLYCLKEEGTEWKKKMKMHALTAGEGRLAVLPEEGQCWPPLFVNQQARKAINDGCSPGSASSAVLHLRPDPSSPPHPATSTQS